jgi:hypothetical protein
MFQWPRSQHWMRRDRPSFGVLHFIAMLHLNAKNLITGVVLSWRQGKYIPGSRANVF